MQVITSKRENKPKRKPKWPRCLCLGDYLKLSMCDHDVKWKYVGASNLEDNKGFPFLLKLRSIHNLTSPNSRTVFEVFFRCQYFLHSKNRFCILDLQFYTLNTFGIPLKCNYDGCKYYR